jgi:L-threonylcarbamoyladenylate synthase
MNIFIIPTNTCFWIACPIKNIDNYKKIYEIKNRDYSKPLAILCDSFEYLEENTLLNKEQINFLKNYQKPWTILIDKEKITDKKLLNQIEKLPNTEIYQKIAFRVAHNFMQNKLIRLNWLLFLTSANKSWKPEIFSSLKIKEEFKNEIEKYSIKVFAHNDFCINSHQTSSDIFEFIENTDNIKYLRKN